MNEAQKEFAKRMKQYRLDKGWTLQQMATVTGLDIRTIWNIENEKVIPHELTVAKIKKALRDLGITVIEEEGTAK